LELNVNDSLVNVIIEQDVIDSRVVGVVWIPESGKGDLTDKRGVGIEEIFRHAFKVCDVDHFAGYVGELYRLHECNESCPDLNFDPMPE
jgi:hypothetical protein